MSNFDAKKHARRSIRLREYDYSTPGAYFVTICIHEKRPVFGNIVNSEMNRSSAGRMVSKWFMRLPEKFPDLECDAFICMPNHVHFIVFIHDIAVTAKKTSLSTAIQWFKTMTTNEYIKGVKIGLYQPFPKRLWQRNYWERVIRDEEELNRTREYVENNPLLWNSDEFFLP